MTFAHGHGNKYNTDFNTNILVRREPVLDCYYTVLFSFECLHTGYTIARYRGFHEKGTFSVHSFNDDYLSIPERPGSYKYLFHEIPVM